MDTRQALAERFAALPARITLQDIGAATGRDPHYVRHYWANQSDQGFPAAAGTTDTAAREWDTAAVLQWCVEHEIGIQLHADEIEDVRRDQVNTAEIAERLGLKDRSAVRYHARKHPPGSTDPYPDVDEDGRRYWPDVLAWHRRHEKAPRTKPGKKPAAGLTPRLQEVQDLVDAANRAGEDLTAGQLAEQLQIHPDSAGRLLRELRRAAGQ